MYNSSVALFRDAVSSRYEEFARVQARAQKVREAQGLQYVPLSSGLGAYQNNSRGNSGSAKSIILRSVLEGI